MSYGGSNKAEVQRRIAIIVELISKKYKRSEIVDYIETELEWGIRRQMIYNYINKAKGQVVEMLHKSAEQNMAESVMDLRYLYRQALGKGQLSTALNIRKEMNRLLHIGEVATREEKGGDELSEELEGMIMDVTPTRKKLLRPSGEKVSGL